MSLAVCFLLLAARRPDLQAEFAKVAHSVDGEVGVAAVLVEGGSVVSYLGDQRFPTQSVYKVPISMAVLSLVEKGKLSLDGTVTVKKSDLVPKLHSPLRDRYPNGTSVSVRDLIRYAIVESDGTASDVLMSLAGGAKSVTAYLRSVGVKDFTVATSEREQLSGPMVQYKNWATPEGAVMLLRQLVTGRGLNAENRGLVLQFMTETQTFPGRIKGLLPPGTVVAHKTGSSFTEAGLTRVTNDIGLIQLANGKHLALAVFLRESHASDKARDLVIAKLARAAWDSLGR